MKALTKTQVKKIIKDKGQWSGWIAQSNVNSFHITGGWRLGLRVTVHSIEELNKTVDHFLAYNNDAELGRRARYWVK
jgi:hypothetical protein